MLSRPARGFSRSVNAHNVDLVICSDWLEASVLFDGGELAGADVVDLLCDDEIYDDQDFAWELVNDAFSTIQERSRVMGQGYPLELSGTTRLRQKGDWDQYASYSFCLILSLVSLYPQWARSFGADHTQQGELFERLTAESIGASLHGWRVHQTGWTRTATRGLGEIVREVAGLLGESTGNVMRWSKERAKEAGLDVLCFRPFPDGRVGVPTFLFQCASGEDWKGKLKTPDLRIWTKVIEFASDPKKAFSTPFAFSTKDFALNCLLVDGLLLDRHRLLAPGLDRKDWVSADLATHLIEWTRPRVAQLGTFSADNV